MAAAGLVLLGGLASIATTSAQQQAVGGGLRRFRLFDYKSNTGVDSSSYFDESPLVHEAFGDFEDIAETELFFRNLGSMSSSSSSTSSSSSKSKDSGDGPSPTPKPPTMMKPPTMRPPTMEPGPGPTPKPPTTEPGPEPTPVPPSPTEAPVSSDTDSPTMDPTPNCNLSPEKRNKEILNVLSSVSSKSDLRDFTTPQGMAYEFITEDDRAQLCPDDDNLIQRYVAAVLYYSTEGDGWTECFEGDRDCGEGVSYYGGKDAFLSEDSECDWAGLTCNRSGELERIELYDNNLGGTIPSELGALSTIDTIELQENAITGSMPSEICDNVSPLGMITSLTSDCGGIEPLVECDCCTRCYRP